MPSDIGCTGISESGLWRKGDSAMDLSQEELAQKIGVTRQTIGMIEAGKYNPTLNLCIAICKALNKTLDELFWEE